MKQKLNKVPPKLSVAKRFEPALPRSLHQIDDISLIFRPFFFYQTNLVFNSKLNSFRHNLFTFLQFVYNLFTICLQFVYNLFTICLRLYLLIIDILRN